MIFNSMELLHYKKFFFLRYPVGWSDDLKQNLGLSFSIKLEKLELMKKSSVSVSVFGFGVETIFGSRNSELKRPVSCTYD